MKKLIALLAALLLVVSCAGVAMAEDEITLDVIICQYGNNTENWFLGTGMNGTSFVKKFEAENPGIKLNLEVVSWDDVRSEVSTRITNNKQPDILNIDWFSGYQGDGLLMPVKDYCSEELFWLLPVLCTTMLTFWLKPALRRFPRPGPSWKMPARPSRTSITAKFMAGVLI